MRVVDKETYKKVIKRQGRTGKNRLACSFCVEDDPSVIEEHHIYGQYNSDERIPVCKNCHIKITNEQNKISPKLRSSSESSYNKTGFILISIGSLLNLAGEKLIDLGHEECSHE
jgi:ferredoxin